jgi:hypothetical protein
VFIADLIDKALASNTTTVELLRRGNFNTYSKIIETGFFNLTLESTKETIPETFRYDTYIILGVTKNLKDMASIAMALANLRVHVRQSLIDGVKTSDNNAQHIRNCNSTAADICNNVALSIEKCTTEDLVEV